EPVVAAQVLHLLRLGLRLEPDRTVDEPVPHGDEVDPAPGPDRRHRHRALLVQERVDLLVGHLDGGALVDSHERQSALSCTPRATATIGRGPPPARPRWRAAWRAPASPTPPA